MNIIAVSCFSMHFLQQWILRSFFGVDFGAGRWQQCAQEHVGSGPPWEGLVKCSWKQDILPLHLLGGAEVVGIVIPPRWFWSDGSSSKDFLRLLTAHSKKKKTLTLKAGRFKIFLLYNLWFYTWHDCQKHGFKRSILPETRKSNLPSWCSPSLLSGWHWRVHGHVHPWHQ